MNIPLTLTFDCNLDSDVRVLEKLILETKNAFRESAIPAFVARLVREFDARVCSELCSKDVSTEWGELHVKLLGKTRCCQHSNLERYKRERKKLVSSLGLLQIDWIRLRCCNCRASFVPMRTALGLERYQSESQEFVKLACETVVEQSYRRAKRHLSRIGGIEITHMRLHRIIMNSDCDTIHPDIRATPIKYLIADGTGYPEFRPKMNEKPRDSIDLETDKRIKKNQKSEIKTVIGIADLLICDGAEALVSHMAKLTRDVQRCQWHVPHDFFHLLRYPENVDQKVASDLTAKLYGAIQLEVPNGPKSPHVDQELERLISKAEISVAELINELRLRRHMKAATYLLNAKNYLFTYLRYWLATGVLPPKASSRIERLMGEFKRRIKKIGFNWSANGVAKITRILLKLLASKSTWTAEWQERLGLTATLSIRFVGAACPR
ncbi:MAG: hypothetical protein RJB38_2377 [Pseudomonadota bacterium]